MATHVALLRDEGSPLTLEGTVRISEDHPGDVTTHPVPDRSFSTDGRTRRPVVITIEVSISPSSTAQGVTTGVARLQEVRAWLLRASNNAEPLDVQQPGRSLAVDFVIKSYRIDRDPTDTEKVSIVLQQLRIATSESIVLTSTRQTTPSDAAASGLAEESDKGTTTTTPVRSQSVLDALLFGGTGG